MEHSRSPRCTTEAVVIAEDLELDVPRRLDVLLDVDVGHAERRFRFPLRGLDRVRQLAGGAHHAHAAAAAAGGGLHDHGISNVLRDLERPLLAVEWAVAAREDRHAGLPHDAAGAGLVPHETDDLRVRADEPDVARLADLRQVRAFGKKPVAGMNGVRAGNFSGADHGRHVQVAVGAARGTDAHVFVGEFHVQRVFVGLRIHGHGLDAELAAGIDHPQRHFAAVRDQDFLEHLLRFDGKQPLAVLHRLSVLHVDARDFAVVLGIDLVHQLHRFDDAEHVAFLDGGSHFHERRRAGL